MFSVDSIKNKSEKDLDGKYFKYFLCVLSIYAIFLLMNIFKNDKSFFFFFFEFIVIVLINYYLCNLNLNIALRQDRVLPEMGSIIRSAFKVILIALAALGNIIIGLLCFIIPGSLAVMWYSQGIYIFLEDKTKSPKQCLKESRIMIEPHISKFFDLQISFLPEIILGFLTFGVAFIWIIPLMQVSNANFYLFTKEYYERQLEIEKEKGIKRYTRN